jgi:uncharacterized membrane protein
MKRNRLLRVLKITAIGLIAVTLFGEVITQLWNWLMPGLFGWHLISFWQALGLLILSKIFFGSFGGRRGFGGPGRRRMTERWEQMTAEEREQFRQGMRGRCGKFAEPKAETTA